MTTKMMASELEDEVAALARDAGRLLAFQGELGLTGLDTRLSPPRARDLACTDAPVSATSLEELSAASSGCTRCKLAATRTNIVFGAGSPKARLMFIGEGPGRDEDLQGEPFVGAAGQLLDKMIAAMGLMRGEVYIANIIKCRPPQNRDPEPDEVSACIGFLRAQVRLVAPEAIVALGRVAAQTLLENTTPISRLRGTWRLFDGTPLMPTFHPAYLLRNPADKRKVWDDLQAVMQKLGLRRQEG